MSKKTSRILAGAAVAGAAVMGATLAPAGIADATPLPGAYKSKNLEGGSVSIRLFDESYSIQNSVANNHFSREVFVSGKVRVQTSGSVKGGNVNVGYIVGCQLNFGAGAGGGAGISSKFDPTSGFSTPGPTDGTGTSAAFELSPGEAAYAPVIQATVGGDSVNSFDFSNAGGGVAYSQERFGVDGCAGYAEAMAKVTVKVKAPGFSGNVTMYGKPFSIG